MGRKNEDWYDPTWPTIWRPGRYAAPENADMNARRACQDRL